MKVETKIVKVKGDWEEVVNDCRFTANKSDLGHTPSDKFIKRALIAEHSPIRDISFKWEWHLPHWVGVHWVRHKWECFVSTQRTDRTGIDRTKLPQDSEQGFRGEANIQHLIDTARKRLCMKASKETREYAESLKAAIKDEDANVANVLVPNCVYRGGCPEYDHDDPNKCRVYESFVNYCISNGVDTTNIQARYDAYAEWRNK